MGLADNIKRLRLQKQLSQPGLAARSGLSKGYVYMLEAGDMTNPSLGKLLKISEALDCTIADLVDEPRATPRANATPEIPESLQTFAKRMKREGNPLQEADLRALAHIQYRGQRPKTVEDWDYVYQTLKRTLGKGK